MAAQTGKFVDDGHLRPRDNSGGPKGPHGIMGSDFGDGGKPVGGESAPGGRPDEADARFTLRSGGNYKRMDSDKSVGRGSY